MRWGTGSTHARRWRGVGRTFFLHTLCPLCSTPSLESRLAKPKPPAASLTTGPEGAVLQAVRGKEWPDPSRLVDGAEAPLFPEVCRLRIEEDGYNLRSAG